MTVMIIGLCLSAAALRRYRASAAGVGHNPSAEARSVGAPVPNLSAPSTAPAPRSVVQASPTPMVVGPVVAFTVYPEGLEPVIAHIRAGPVTIMILNHSGGVSQGVSIQQLPQPGSPVGQVGWSNNGTFLGENSFNLQTGTYQISDASNPNNTAQLVVQ